MEDASFDKYIVARDKLFWYRRCPYCGQEIWDRAGEKPIGFRTHMGIHEKHERESGQGK
jgi:hypothetical protein